MVGDWAKLGVDHHRVPVKAASESEAYSLPEGRAGSAYEFRLQSEGGLPPFKWTVLSGELPSGIELDASGLLRGAPKTPQRLAYSFVLQVADSSEPAQTATQQFRLMVLPAVLRIVTAPAKKLGIVPPDCGTNVIRRVSDASSSGASTPVTGRVEPDRPVISRSAEPTRVNEARTLRPCEACIPSDRVQAQSEVRIDARTGGSSGLRRFKKRERVRITIINKNPFLYAYKTTINETVVQDTSLGDFAKSLGGPIPGLLGVATEAPKKANGC